MSNFSPRVPWSNIQHWKYIIGKKWRRRFWFFRVKTLCNFRWIPVKDRLFPWVQCLAFVHGELNIPSYLFRWTAHRRACHCGQCWVLKLQIFKSVFDPLRDQCCFLLYTQLGKVQEITDQRILPILWRLNWNHFLPLIYNLRELFGPAIPLEPPAHARLVRTQVVAISYQNDEKPLGFHATKEGPIAVVLSLEVRCATKSFLILVSEKKKCLPPRIWYSATTKPQTVLLPYDFFLLKVLNSNSRGHHHHLGILFLELRPEALQELWWEVLSFLGSNVSWGCNQESLSINDSAQIRIVMKTAPRHLCDLDKKATEQVLLSAHANP